MSAIARITSISTPPAAKAGDNVVVQVTLQNVGDAAGDLIAVVNYWSGLRWVVAATGSTVATWTEQGATNSPSFFFTMPATNTTVRVYAHHGTEDPEGGTLWTLDEWKAVSIALQIPPPPSGQIVRVFYSYPGMTGWEILNPTNPPSVPQDTNLSLGIAWANTSSVDVVGHVDLTITRPDGTMVTPAATQDQDRVGKPTNGWTVFFEPAITLNQLGAWRARAILTAL